MIKYLSEKIARYVCKGDDSAAFEVLAYGYDIFLQEAGIILIALLLALPFGLLLQVLVSILSYNLLRRYAGGTHARHRILCIVSSVLVMFAPSFLFAKTLLRIPLPVMAALYVLDMLLLYRYAPADTDTRPVRNPDTRKSMRRAALLIMSAYAIVSCALFFWRPDFACLVMVIATVVCLMTHPVAYKLYGCRRSTDMEAELPTPS